MPASDVAANTAFSSMTAGVDFSVEVTNLDQAIFDQPTPTGPLHEAVTSLSNADLTTTVIGGSGTFDVIMSGLKAHLDIEYKNNRITGGEYTKAYIAAVEGAMSNAVQFLLGKDTAYWQAIGAQMQAQTAQVQLVQARVALETEKAKLRQVQIETQLAKATYALTKLKLASETVAYDTALYNLSSILPQQLLLLQGQTQLVTQQTAVQQAQVGLVEEQVEVQRAQTLDTRTDGITVVTGSVGKQKALYEQQIQSYKRDAEVKAAKIFTDAWITQKSMDEGTLPPTNFSNASLDTILAAIKLANDLD